MGAIYYSSCKHQEWAWSPCSWRAGVAEVVPFLSSWTPLSFYQRHWGPQWSKRNQICSHTRRTWTSPAPRAQAGSRVDSAGGNRVWNGQSWACPLAGRENPAWAQALTHHCSIWGWGRSKTLFLRLNWDFLEAHSCTYKGSLPGNQSLQCLSSELWKYQIIRLMTQRSIFQIVK